MKNKRESAASDGTTAQPRFHQRAAEIQAYGTVNHLLPLELEETVRLEMTAHLNQLLADTMTLRSRKPPGFITSFLHTSLPAPRQLPGCVRDRGHQIGITRGHARALPKWRQPGSRSTSFILSGRNSKGSLERLAESGVGIVANRFRHLEHFPVALPQQRRGFVHSPVS